MREDAGRVRVVAALIAGAKRGTYLVQERPPGGARALSWEFPGGKVEPGETDVAALVRECKEELAVVLEVRECLMTSRHDYADLSVEIHLYRAVLASGELHPVAGQRIEFLTPKEMIGRTFSEADVPIVEGLRAGRIR